MTAGRRELLEDGHRRRLRQGRRTFRGTTGRTEQRADQAGVHRGERTTSPRDLRVQVREQAAAGASVTVRRPGLGARPLATSDEARAGWYIADYSAFLLRAQVTEYRLETKLDSKEIAATTSSSKVAVILNQ